MNQFKDNEFDFFTLIEILWSGKWIIIVSTFVFGIASYLFTITTPNHFEVTSPINKGRSSVFVDFIPLNTILQDNFNPENENKSYLINSKNMFEMFISEFNDYEEMISSLRKSEYVKQSIKDLNEKQQNNALINYAKSFKIIIPTKKSDPAILMFKWHNVREGTKLFTDALLLTLNNVKKTAFNNILTLALSLESQKKIKIRKLQIELDQIQKTIQLKNKRRIRYLEEQSAIAKTLGIKKNTLDFQNIEKQNTKNQYLPMPKIQIFPSYSHLDNFPYYLRGSVAIDKELELINSRSIENSLINSNEYLIVKGKLYTVENDFTAEQLKSYYTNVSNYDISGWVDYDLDLSDSKSNRRSTFITTILGMILGGFLAIIYLSISYIFRKYKQGNV